MSRTRRRFTAEAVRLLEESGWPLQTVAEVAIPWALFAEILRRIDRLQGPPIAVA